MQKLSLLFIPAVIATILYIGFSAVERLNEPVSVSEAGSQLTFNAFSEGINTISFDLAGNIDYTLQADRQVHFNDDTTVLTNPLIKLYQNGDVQWNIVADSGTILTQSEDNEDNSHQFELVGNVEVYSIDEFGNRIRMTTSMLLLDPQYETLSTEEAVAFTDSSMHHTAVGMFADLSTNIITFNKNNRGSYGTNQN